MGDIEIYIKFHPGGQFYFESLKKEKTYAQELRTKRYEVDVPLDATQVELWFRNFYVVSSMCEAWDSQFGRNYWFDVAHG
jgi:hypothetical protein